MSQSLMALKMNHSQKTQQNNDPGGLQLQQENRVSGGGSQSVNPSVLNLAFNNPRFSSLHNTSDTKASAIRLPKIKQQPQLSSNSHLLRDAVPSIAGTAKSIKTSSSSSQAAANQKMNNFIDAHLDDDSHNQNNRQSQMQQTLRKENINVSSNTNAFQNRKPTGASLMPLKMSSPAMHLDYQQPNHQQLSIGSAYLPSSSSSASSQSKKQTSKLSGVAALQQKQLRLLGQTQQPASPFRDTAMKARLPGFIQAYACRSKAGANYQGPKRNQDNFIIATNMNKLSNRYLFAVCDGHGQYGHDVSAFIRNRYPKILEGLLARDLKCVEKEYIMSCLRLSFLQLSQKLLESRIDISFSGSTFVAVLIIDDMIWCANTGDSRAILGIQGDAAWECYPLSDDHKADRSDERQRIVGAGGRVDTYRDLKGLPIGPARVWMKDEDIPGLAMSRSFGDLIAVSCGVTCDPEISFRVMEVKDSCIVIASDGVWEFLENADVISYAAQFYDTLHAEQASDLIVKEANAAWRSRDSIVDDITALCVYLYKEDTKKEEEAEVKEKHGGDSNNQENQHVQNDARQQENEDGDGQTPVMNKKNKQASKQKLDDPSVQQRKIQEEILDEEGVDEEQLSFF